jgi:hypothetical protein
LGEVGEDLLLKSIVLNNKFDYLVDESVWKGNIKEKEVTDFIAEQEDRDTIDRFKDEFKFAHKVKDLPFRSFWLSFKRSSLEKKARTFDQLLGESNTNDQIQLWSEINLAYKAMYKTPESRRDAFSKFKRELGIVQGEKEE